jgi:uncharacterized tellurite resistance protein B-like protein
MWNRLKEFLRGLPAAGGNEEDPAGNDVQVAAAALLFHVVDADGVRDDAERERLEAVLAREFGLTGGELDRLLHAGDRANREAVDLYSFTAILNRRMNREEKLGFVRVLWEIVYADGDRNELEDNLVWRIAELLHVEREDRIALRRAVEGKPE